MNARSMKRHLINRTGAMLPMFALVMVILFVAVVFSVDVARMHVTRAELRTATDAAARAGAEALGRTQDTNAAIAAAIDVASRNQVAGRALTVTPAQVLLGESRSQNSGVFQFAPGGAINSVQVTGSRRAGSADGAVTMLFGPLFGVTQFEPQMTSTAVRSDRDIALVLDVSGSMASNNRFSGLINALRAFQAELNRTPQREQVSLTVYSTTGRKLVNLTSDLNQIESAMSRQVPNGFTAIGEGLKLGIRSLTSDPLARPFAEKAVIVMTDGNHNTGVSPDVIARANPKTKIHTITFGAGANQALMRAVAAPSGGISLHAANNAQLEQAFRDIARQLSVLLID
ncbi:MAG: vWA domain-containing protein [Pirellulaceae bacterium]